MALVAGCVPFHFPFPHGLYSAFVTIVYRRRHFFALFSCVDSFFSCLSRVFQFIREFASPPKSCRLLVTTIQWQSARVAEWQSGSAKPIWLATSSMLVSFSYSNLFIFGFRFAKSQHFIFQPMAFHFTSSPLPVRCPCPSQLLYSTVLVANSFFCASAVFTSISLGLCINCERRKTIQFIQSALHFHFFAFAVRPDANNNGGIAMPSVRRPVNTPLVTSGWATRRQ